jgi:hypothetical protein
MQLRLVRSFDWHEPGKRIRRFVSMKKFIVMNRQKMWVLFPNMMFRSGNADSPREPEQ